MANFNTHLNIAVVSTGLASAVLLSAAHIGLNSALWLWFLGAVGGLLPDIDSDNSTSLDSIFNLFALSIVLIVLRHMTFTETHLIELITIPLAVYGVMRFLIRPVFEKITVHRGSCHSLLFLLFCALLTTQLTWRLSADYTEQSEVIAWLSGGFVFLGGFIHLLLDEICSVDLQNARIKRSFGTALKLIDFNNKGLALLMLMASGALVFITPSPDETIKLLTNWSKLQL